MIRHYEIIRPIGHGGMGSVYRARDTRLGRLVAIKIISIRRKEQMRRFTAEARTTARFNHEHIVVIHDVGHYQDTPYIVLEHLEGQTLSEIIEAGPVSSSRAVELMLPVVHALAHAHSHGIIHRDLKPSNIMVTWDGVIKVLDFGIAKVLARNERKLDHGDATGFEPVLTHVGKRTGTLPYMAPEPVLTQAGKRTGTLPYMAPEQWHGEPVNPRTDLWAVGIILYMLLAGRHPLAPMSPATLATIADRDIPMPRASERWPDSGRLAAIIDRCLSKHNEYRFAEATELISELNALQSDLQRRLDDDQTQPYMGLAAFREGDSGHYYGRKSDVLAVSARLHEQPIVALVGPSGIGKSSFVHAALIPMLRRASDPWQIHTIRPGRQPLAALIQLALQLEISSALANKIAKSTGQSKELWDRISTNPNPASDSEQDGNRPTFSKIHDRLHAQPGNVGVVLRAYARQRRCRLLLFVDHFEELYTLVEPKERQAFVECIDAIADDPASPVRVLLTMRSDFLDRLSDNRSLTVKLTTGLILLPALNRHSLREALVNPIQRLGFRFESDDMVTDILDALEQTRCALPLLQFTATQLWERRDRENRQLTRSSYEQIGGVAGTLASHADAVLASMSRVERRLAQAIFLRLVTPERTRSLANMEELAQLRAGNDSLSSHVLSALIKARLLTVTSASGDENSSATVEIVHESLVHSWPALAAWLDESQGDALYLNRVRHAAEQWDENGRPPGLLWRDTAMEDVRRWHRHYTGELSPVESAFMDAVFALADRSARIRHRTIAMIGCCLVIVLAMVSYLAWKENLASEIARNEAVRAREEAARAQAATGRAERAAVVARDAALLAAAREAEESDPTLALALLREVETARDQRNWQHSAAVVARAPVAYAVLRGHTSDVRDSDYDPHGRWVLTASDDGTARVWNADGGGSPFVFLDHTAPILMATFSPDGERVLTAAEDGTARIWNADGSGAVVVLQPHAPQVFAASFSPDGRLVATSDEAGVVRIFAADGSGLMQRFSGHEGAVWGVEFHPNGSTVATFGFDGTVRIWPIHKRSAESGQTNRQPIVIRAHRDSINALAFSPDGHHIATASDDRTARIFATDGTGSPVILSGHQKSVLQVQFSGDGQRVLTSSYDHTARVWSADGSGQPLVLSDSTGWIWNAVFSPDSRWIATGSHDQTARVYRADGVGEPIVLRGHSQAVIGLAWSSDSERLITGSEDATARLWHLGKIPAADVRHDRAGSLWRWSRDGSRAAAYLNHGKVVRLWQVEPASQFGGISELRVPAGEIKTIALSGDGNVVAAATYEGHLVVWRIGRGNIPKVSSHHPGVFRLALNWDGSRVAGISKVGQVFMWNVNTEVSPKVLAEFPMHATWLEFSPDGSRLLVTEPDHLVRLFSMDGTRSPVEMAGHTTYIYSATFNHDGTAVASASADQTARVWDTETGAVRAVLRGHDSDVYRVRFSPDGSAIATGSADRTARVWAADGTGQPVVLSGHSGSWVQVRFNSDGQRIASHADDNLIRVWNVDGSGVPLVLSGHRGRIHNARFTSDGRHILSMSTDGTIRRWPSVDDIPDNATLLRTLWQNTGFCIPASIRSTILGTDVANANVNRELCLQRTGQ